MQVTQILIIVACIALAIAVYFTNMKRKETWFSRDRNYGLRASEIWNATVAKGLKGIADENADLKQMYPYLGYGDFTGMICKGPQNQGCTTYANYTR